MKGKEEGEVEYRFLRFLTHYPTSFRFIWPTFCRKKTWSISGFHPIRFGTSVSRNVYSL